MRVFIPELVPNPVAWATYSRDPDTHFFLCDFVDMHDKIPDAGPWATAVASLHLKSMGKSPTGQFGFHVTTYLAYVPVNNAWNTSWEAFWAQQMHGLFSQEEEANGHEDVLAGLKTRYFEQVIPRYLGPLERDGRSVIPCLVHSDTWPGNIKPRVSNGELCIFDSSPFWGHNEGWPIYTSRLGCWRK